MPQFYLIAMYAKKLNVDDLVFSLEEDRGVQWQLRPGLELHTYLQTPYAIWAQGVVADDQNAAKERALLLLLDECPPDEGWIDHRVSLNTVSRATLERVCRDAVGQHETGRADNDDEWPDVIFMDGE